MPVNRSSLFAGDLFSVQMHSWPKGRPQPAPTELPRLIPRKIGASSILLFEYPDQWYFRAV
jgi:hypothetical protein